MKNSISLPSTPFSQFQSSLQSSLESHLHAIANQRVNQATPSTTFEPIPYSELSSALDALWSTLPTLPPAAAELQRSIVSSVLISVVSETAYPSQLIFPESVHRQLLHDALDLSLVFVEQDRAPAELTLSCIEDILETATVEEAERIFSYLETRVDRLTVGMLPDRGKGLIFLRMQNSLLRRLSKSLHTVFCGRILSFLSSVFPIAEKSGVNLRGAFNTGNVTHFDQEVERKDVEPMALDVESLKPAEMVDLTKADEARGESMSLDMSIPAPKQEAIAPSDQLVPASKEPNLNVEEIAAEKPIENPEEPPEVIAARLRAKAEEQEARAKAKAASKAAADKREFYLRFWALQSLLSNPPELFKGWQPDPNANPTSSTQSNSLYLPSRPASIATASTAPQRASPAREVEVQPSTANLKRLKEGMSKTLEVFSRMTKKEKELGTHSKKPKIDERNLVEVKEQYFFPKFLTKSNLLDLEIADSYFRRQVLTQFLIILQYIRGFSLEERNKRSFLPRSNRVNDVPYVYQPRDDVWVLKLNSEVWKTLYATPPNGEVFAMTIQQILIREHNWIMWKASSCPSFERPSMSEESIKATEVGYKRITAPPMKFPHPVGTPALSKLWSNKVTRESIDRIDLSAGVPDLNALHAKIVAQDKRLMIVKKRLLAQGQSTVEVSKDPDVQEIEERKSSLSWRALRVAQSTHLQLFGKIGLPGDVNKLMSLIEEAKARPSTARQVQSSSQNVTTPVTVATTGAAESKDLDGDSVQLVTNGENHDGQPVLIDQPDIVMLDGESIEDSNPSTFKSVFLSEPEEEQPTPPAAVQPTVVQPTPMPIPTPTHTPTSAPVADPVAQSQPQSQPQSRPHSAPRFNNGRPQHHPLHSPVPRVHLSVPNHRTNTDSEIDQMIRRVEASASVSPALARSHSSDYRSGLHSLPSNPNRLGSGGGPPVKRTADDEGVMDNGMKKSKT